MALVINTNVASLTAQNNLSTSQARLNTSLARLSSGLRINSAKDDAAGLAVATRMESQIRGNAQAIRNANDGISLAQTGESLMGQIQENLQRINELANQSANGSISDDDRGQLQKEVDQLTQENSRIISTGNYNNINLFDGTQATLDFQIGAESTDTVSISLSNLTTAGTLNTYAASLTATSTIDISTQAAASTAIDDVSDDLDTITGLRSDFGAVQSRFDAISTQLTSANANLSAAKSRIMDADYSAETANLTKQQIIQQAGIASLSQANSIPQQVLSLLQ